MGISLTEIEQYNNLAKQKNAERQQIIGRQKSLAESYQRALEAYKVKYGVELTDQTLQKEYTDVYSQVVKESNELSATLQDIQNGNYATVVDKFTIDTEAINPDIVNSTPTEVKQEVVQAVDLGTPVSTPAPVNLTPVQNVVEPQTANTGVTFEDMMANLKLDDSDADSSEDISEKPFQPEGWGVADKADINANFEGILQKSEV